MNDGAQMNIPYEAVDAAYDTLPKGLIKDGELQKMLRVAAPYIIMQYLEHIAELEKEVEAAHAANDDGCKSAYYVGYEHGHDHERAAIVAWLGGLEWKDGFIELIVDDLRFIERGEHLAGDDE